MTTKNKFGFAPLDTDASVPRKSRGVGPMGAAVREAAESMQESTEAKTEQRRQNAEDAKSFRAADADGLVLQRIALSEIQTTDLPRDRIDLARVATSDEMEELKSSIRSRGQKEPIEVYRDGAGGLQLKKGWRRWTALSQLFDETGDEAFAIVVARIEHDEADRMSRYIDMVEENVVREDLSFAEMAYVVLRAMEDDSIELSDIDQIVQRLYGSLHKMKRSYIRTFCKLLAGYGDHLRWPKAISRNLGVETWRAIEAGGDVSVLLNALPGAESAVQQNEVLADFVKRSKSGQAAAKPTKQTTKEKFEFHTHGAKVTARKGECRIVSSTDFTSVPRQQLEKAVQAFNAVLDGK